MVVTAKELRFKINMLFNVLSKGEDITITYRGKPKAKLVSVQESHTQKDDAIFGLWKDRDGDAESMVRELRRGRRFDI